MPLSRSKELQLHEGVPRCFGQDLPTPQASYTKAYPCAWPNDDYKYTTSPVRASFPPGARLSGSVLECCNRTHYDDIDLSLYFGNKVVVPVSLTHVAITRLMLVEAHDFFAAEEGTSRHAELVKLKHNVFRAIEEGPNPTFLCQSVEDKLRVTGVSFRYKKP